MQLFVPMDLLKLLQINNIRALKYGLVSQRNLTLVHAELEHFDSITASMTPEEKYAFLVSNYVC